jgi:RND family efflux transporter MFP subunit
MKSSVSFIILFLFLNSCVQPEGKTDLKVLPTIEVQVSSVEVADYSFGTAIPGTVQSQDSATLESKLNTRVEDVLVREGDRVKQGQLLVSLDKQEITARLNQAQAANKQAENDLRRYQALLPQKAISRQDFDNAQSRAQIAAAALAEAETVLAYTQIIAPFDGVISRKFVSAGDLATIGKPLIQIDNPSVLRFESAVPEGSISSISIGQRCLIDIASIEQLEGVVSEISPSADLATRSYAVKLDLPNNNELRLGQYGTLVVPKASEKTITVERRSVIARGQLEMVFVVQDNKANLRLVRTGRTQGSRVEILSGLQGNEEIVLAPDNSLVDQQPVSISG